MPRPLAAADVGMAMGNGTDVAMHAAGITLMRGDPMLVAAALDISHRTVSKIRQNLFWAFAYNVAGIPLAALGYLSPVVAGRPWPQFGERDGKRPATQTLAHVIKPQWSAAWMSGKLQQIVSKL